MTDEPQMPAVGPPKWLLILEVGYVAALVILALLYLHWGWLRHVVPSPSGPVPLSVPWWGALGGVMISLSGIFKHPRDWDRYLNNWHVTRPVLGAVMGTIGFLILFVVLRSTGASVPRTGTTYDVIAFLVGYREELFRSLLKRATDVLLSTANPSANQRGTHES